MTEGSEQKPEGSPNCAKCGACSAVCPVYQVTGRESLTARGRLHLLGQLTRPLNSRTFREIFSKCLLCGACAAVCPRGIDITTLTFRTRMDVRTPPGITFLKKWLTRQTLVHPALLKIAGRTLEQIGKASRLLPANSGLRLRIPEIPELAPGRGYISGQREPATPPQALYFTGCLANYLSPAIARAANRLVEQLDGRELYAPPQQGCCGIAALSAGDLEQAMKLARQNIKAYDATKWRTLPVFTSCASCYAQLKDYPRLLANDKKWAGRAYDFATRVQEFSSYLLEHGNLTQGQPEIRRQRVVYHDPCHLRFGAGHDCRGIRPDPARQLITRVRSLELTELPHGPQCCGQGGTFHISHPGLAQEIGQRLWHDFTKVNSPLVTTTCTGCLLQWQQGLRTAGITARVVHLAILLGEHL